MQSSTQYHLDQLAERIASHEVKLQAVNSGLSAMLAELGSVLEALEWDRARIEGLKALAALSEPDPVTDAKPDVDSAFYADAINAEATCTGHAHIEDLTTIEGIDTATAFKLAGMGLTRFVDISALNDEDVEEIGKVIGDSTRIIKDNWIGQAAILARGGSTEYSRRPFSGEAQVTIITEETTTPANVSEATVPTIEATTKPVTGEIVLFKPRPAQRKRNRYAAVAAVASLVVALSGTAYLASTMPGGIGDHLSRLGSCSAEALHGDGHCAVLAWLAL